MEAVSASGGVLRTAATSNGLILRRIEAGQKRTQVAVNLKEIMKGTSNDIPLRAGDILIVPTNGGKRAALRALDVAIQAGLLIGTSAAVQ
jgi:protein involved in polysaccharide export with SLBB domain